VAVAAVAAQSLVLVHSAEQLWGLAAAVVGAGVVVAEVAEVQQTRKNVRINYHKR